MAPMTPEEKDARIQVLEAQVASLSNALESQKLALDTDQASIVDAAIKEVRECPERVAAALFRSSVEMLSSPRLPPEMRVAAAEQTMARITMMRTALNDVSRVK